MRDNFLIYRNQFQALMAMPAEDVKELLKLIGEYAMDEKDPDTESKMYPTFLMIQPLINRNNRNYENGIRGGRPKNVIDSSQVENRNEEFNNRNDEVDNRNQEFNNRNDEFNNRNAEFNNPKVKGKRINDKGEMIKEKGEKEEESEKPPASAAVPYKEVMDLYNSICKSYPRLMKMSDERKRAITARFRNGYTLEDFKNVFTKAEASSFMKGDNRKDWQATFDWMIKDGNISKILEGNYDEKREPKQEKPQQRTTSFNNFPARSRDWEEFERRILTHDLRTD